MLRIGVISDTHIPRKAKSLPARLIEGLQGMDMIIHAGDINTDYVIMELEEIAPVHAVAGNTDSWEIFAALGGKKIVEAEGCRIGVVHGDGSYGTTLERAKRAFPGDGVNCVVFGHSHIPYNREEDGILYFNPGSPTDKRRQDEYSYGILTVNDGKVSGELKFYSG